MTEANTENDRLLDPSSWVDRHGDVLYRYARSRVRGDDVAADLVQEAFLHALQSRESFLGNSSERTWLLGILRHKILDRYRRSVGAREKTLDSPEFFDDRGSWKKSGPSEHLATGLERGEFWRGLGLCRESLPPGLASAFALRELDGLASDAICELLGITPANLWTRLHRARLLLKACLERHGYGEDRR
jgi:RNA polymerase sigma-70 factor (ECF subfamily)